MFCSSRLHTRCSLRLSCWQQVTNGELIGGESQFEQPLKLTNVVESPYVVENIFRETVNSGSRSHNVDHAMPRAPTGAQSACEANTVLLS